MNLHLDADTRLVTLGSGVRVVTISLPHLESASVSVFVRTGSSNESKRQSGISHFVEHMAFKGTHTRTCQEINLQARRRRQRAHRQGPHRVSHARPRP